MNWIRIEDQTPERFKEVLVCIGYEGYVTMAFYDGEFWMDNDGIDIKTVTHWMPLPEPPKSRG